MKPYRAIYKKYNYEYIRGEKSKEWYTWEKVWVLDTISVTLGTNENPYIGVALLCICEDGNHIQLDPSVIYCVDAEQFAFRTLSDEHGQIYWGGFKVPESDAWSEAERALKS